MKAQILKIAGVKSEKEFYKKFPTEAAFLKKHGKELAKLKKAQVGTMTQQDTSLTTNVRPIDFEDIKSDATSVFSPLKDRAMELGLDSMTTEEEREEKYREQLELAALENQAKPKKKGLLESLLTPGNIDMAASLFSGGGGGEGVTGSVEVGELEMGAPIGKKGKKVMKFEPHMMYDPKTGKAYKANKKADHERMSKLGYTHEKPKKAQDGVSFEDLGFEIPDEGIFSSADPGGKSYVLDDAGKLRRGNKDASDIAFGGKLADALKSQPVIGDIIEGIGKIKTQKDTLKDLKQMTAVSDIMLRAAQTKPEEIEREYVRPEDIQNTGEEFFPIYGVGTNVLAKNGGMFNNPGYVPLNNVNKIKNFQEGGDFPWQAVSDQASSLFFGDKSERDAGTAIGGGIGRAVGTAFFGPVGGAIGSFVGGGIGDLVDRNDRRQRMERKKIDKNVKELTYSQLGPAVQAGYASHMKDGGIVKNPDLKTVWGGKAKAVAYNPYAGGESIYFEGNSHDKKDPKTGQTGIGVAYGPQSVAANEAVVEVENEPAQIMKEGGDQENLVVFGDLKIPNDYVSEIGDENAKGKKFKKYVNELNEQEAKANKDMSKAIEDAGDSDNTQWGELVRSTSSTIADGADMKLKSIAEKKKVLSNIQSALNDTFDEFKIKGNEFINKGEIVEEVEMAKDGKTVEASEDKLEKIEGELHKASKMHKSQANRIGKIIKGEDGVDIPKAQGDGQQNTPPDNLELNQLPDELPSLTIEELKEQGYTLGDDGKYYRDVDIEGEFEQDVSKSSMKDVPEGQKMGNEQLGKRVAKNVTVEDYQEWKAANPWFFEKYPDWKPETKEDVKLFQTEFNKLAANDPQLDPVRVDGDFGRQTVTARFSTTDSTTPRTRREFANLSEPETTIETTTVAPSKRSIIPELLGLARQFRKDPDNDLDYNQILPEMLAASQNQVDPVYAQTFQPRLRVPYDISMQDSMNEIIAASRAASQNPAVMDNPALLAMMQAPAYEAINKVKGEEFRANQEMKDAVYSGNIDMINAARLKNLEIYDQQQERQAQAVANTKATALEIAKSISDKYQKNKLENRRERVLENLYPQYSFDDAGNMINVGPPVVFNTGADNNQVLTGNPYTDLFNVLTGGGFNPNANVQTTDTTTTVAGGRHGLKRIKRNQKNSNVLRMFKKQ